MRSKEFIQEAVMSLSVQSKYPVSAGARSLMASRWRYDVSVKENIKQSLANAVDQLEHNLKYVPNTKYDAIDMLMQSICEKFRIEPKKLHVAFVKKFNCSPDKYAVKYKKSREGQPAKI